MRSFSKISSNQLHSQTVRGRELNLLEKVHHTNHVSCFTCHYFYHIFSSSYKVLQLVGGGSVINGETPSSFLVMISGRSETLVLQLMVNSKHIEWIITHNLLIHIFIFIILFVSRLLPDDNNMSVNRWIYECMPLNLEQGQCCFMLF